MGRLKALDEKLNIKGKRILIRVDLNVPIKDKKVSDISRIEKIVPVLKEFISRKSKIILISHLGRPQGRFDEKLSLKPVSLVLENLLKVKVHFSSESIGSSVIEKSKKINSGEILLLENIRFHKEEELNENVFSKELSKLGDFFINEAFSCSHRSHASVCEITNHINSYAGKLLIQEVNIINMLNSSAKKPITCIIGGSKISNKIGVLCNLIKRFQTIIIVGAMANNFLKYKGINIGKSLFEEKQEKIIEEIINLSKKNDCKLLIPEDVIVAKNPNSQGKLKTLIEIDNEDMILDIGEQTVKNILKVIDESKTILWNGPAGFFEIKEFAHGSNKIAHKITENTKNKSLISVAGGGDTVAAINNFKCYEGFTYISTAGGAFLELLEGKVLPGIKALEKI